jgi:anti-sigma factor RsiW
MLMRHGRAVRLLSSLPDGLLDDRAERDVRRHVAGCPRCRAELAALEASTALLRRMPASLLPLAGSPAAESRLAGLARWASGPERGRPLPVPRSPGRIAAGWLEAFGLPALGAVVGAAAVTLTLLAGSPSEPAGGADPFNLVLVGELSPQVADRRPARPRDPFQLVSTSTPESAFLPVGVR